MFDFIKARLGATVGPRAEAAVERAILGSAVVKKIEREVIDELASSRASLISELAKLEAEAARVNGEWAAKLAAAKERWENEILPMLDEFNRACEHDRQHAFGASCTYADRLTRLRWQLRDMTPESHAALADKLDARWRKWLTAASSIERYDREKLRDLHGIFLTITREIRDGLFLLTDEQALKREASLIKKAETMLSAAAPQLPPVKGAVRDRNWASCSDPARQIMSYSGGN